MKQKIKIDDISEITPKKDDTLDINIEPETFAKDYLKQNHVDNFFDFKKHIARN